MSMGHIVIGRNDRYHNQQPVPTATRITLPPTLDGFDAIAAAATAEMWDVLGQDMTTSPAPTDVELENARQIA
jgi:hypothetical protein